MKPEDVLKYYKSTYYFNKETGMSMSSLWNWLQWGYVPLKSQAKIQELTGGALLMSIRDAYKKEGV